MKLLRVKLSTWKQHYEDIEQAPFWLQIFKLRRTNGTRDASPEKTKDHKAEVSGRVKAVGVKRGKANTGVTPRGGKLPQPKTSKRVRKESEAK